MRVVEVGPDSKRAIVARQRLRISVERGKCDAAIVPGLGVPRNGGDRTVECCYGLRIPAEAVQRIASIEQRSRMTGKRSDHLVVFDQRFFETAEMRQRIASIDSRQMPRRAPQHRIEALQRLLGALRTEQQETAIVAS